MKLKAVSVITTSIIACTLLGASYVSWASANWLTSGPAEQPAPAVTTVPAERIETAELIPVEQIRTAPVDRIETADLIPVEQIRTVESKQPTLPVTGERYETVAAYFRAGNPNATTYRLGEPRIPRKSFSASERRRIHAENGGCCQICGSTNQLEVEHHRGLQNGGGNERDNLKTLCHDCHVQKTSMDKSLRRQRDKLLKAAK